MLDFDGDMSVYQKRLDTAGVDFDITSLIGLTKWEIESVVKRLIEIYGRESSVSKRGVA